MVNTDLVVEFRRQLLNALLEEKEVTAVEPSDLTRIEMLVDYIVHGRIKSENKAESLVGDTEPKVEPKTHGKMPNKEHESKSENLLDFITKHTGLVLVDGQGKQVNIQDIFGK